LYSIFETNNLSEKNTDYSCFFLLYTGISKLTSILAIWARLTISASLTIILAASSRLSHGRIFKLDIAIKAFASSTFVPWEYIQLINYTCDYF